MNYKLLIGADHAGFEMKEAVKAWLQGLGYEIEDVGAYQFNETDDYPDFVMPMAEQISESKGSLNGIFFAGNGQGEAIAANRFPFVHATVYDGRGEKAIKYMKEHDDSNLLTIGSRLVDEEDVKMAVKIWLETDFSAEERHIRRLKKIEDYSK
jgi:ribose 5-phosphate isomerase B